jgi:hypothetical protein
MPRPKTIPWRKSRTFGDIYGGRRWPKFADNIRLRLHSLPALSPGQAMPILIENNPSRDFCFPPTSRTATARKQGSARLTTFVQR